MDTVKAGPTCADCGADSRAVALLWHYGTWYCLDETACAERVFQANGGDELMRRVDELSAPSPIWPDDEAAHVAETVDELAPRFRISADNLADAIERESLAVELPDDEDEE